MDLSETESFRVAFRVLWRRDVVNVLAVGSVLVSTEFDEHHRTVAAPHRRGQQCISAR